MLNDVPPHIREVMWFQQDGPPIHYIRDERNYLDATFPNLWIGRGGFVDWPPLSTDLSCIDFFLWRQLKFQMYETCIESAEDLVARLPAAAGEVCDTPGNFHKFRQSLFRRCTVVQRKNETPLFISMQIIVEK